MSIPIPQDYEQARSFDGSTAPELTVGGHICRIRNAYMAKTKSGKDQLVIEFDIAEGGEFDGYYQNRFTNAQKYSSNAKWGGVFRSVLLTNEGKTNGFFKGLIEAIEESNVGYDFRKSGGDERAMIGKLVGFNFGEEEYEGYDGNIRTIVKPSYAVSAARVHEGVIPPAKKLLEKNKQQPQAQQAQGYPAGYTEVENNDELPF